MPPFILTADARTRMNVKNVLWLSGMTFHAAPAEATMMGGCCLQVRMEEPLMLLFLAPSTADGKLDRKNDGFGAGLEHLV